jgi:nucleoid-associated protein YgaU
LARVPVSFLTELINLLNLSRAILWHPLPLRKQADQLQFPAEEEFMANLKGLASFVSELRAERTTLVDRLRHVDAAPSVLGKLNSGSNYTKPRHSMSAAARRKISLAQKARWAKAKGHAPKPKRTISAAGKKRIAAAQRARWAKVRAGKKK